MCNLRVEITSISIIPTETPTQQSHVICSDHWTPVIEELVECVLGQEPLQAHNLLSMLVIAENIPGTVEKRKQADLSHAILALEHLLAYVEPEVPIYEIGFERMSVMEANIYRQSLFHEIA